MKISMIIILCWIIGMVLIFEGVHFFVYGWFAQESELDVFFNKHLTNYKLNPYNANSFSAAATSFDLPYIAQSTSFTSKWYIEDQGVIPRWSPWSKKLDERQESLFRTFPPKKNLTDF